jgi:hypothetical protein
MLHDDGSCDESDEEIDTAAYLLAKEGINVRSDDGTLTEELDEDSINKSSIALHHFHLLKLAYQRFGGWPKSHEEYERLNAQLFHTFGHDSNWNGVHGTEKWEARSFGSGKAESQEGVFTGIKDWAFGSDKVILHAQSYSQNGESNGQNGHSNGAANGKLHLQNGHSNGSANGKLQIQNGHSQNGHSQNSHSYSTTSGKVRSEQYKQTVA